MLFVPFWGFTCQQHFNLFLRCNREENVFLLHGSMWRGNKSKFSLKFPSSTFLTNFSYAKEVWRAGDKRGIILLQQTENVSPLLGDNPLEVGFTEKRLRLCWAASHPHRLNNPSLKFLSFTGWLYLKMCLKLRWAYLTKRSSVPTLPINYQLLSKVTEPSFDTFPFSCLC